MIETIRRVLAPWRLDCSPVVLKRADELEPGMVLSSHNDGLGVRPAGERITRVKRGSEYGTPVVYVTGSFSKRWVWTLYVGEQVSILQHSV